MALEWQQFVLPLVKGVQTNTDKRSLPAPELAQVDNAVWDRGGGIQKAPGRTAISTIISGFSSTTVPLSDVKGLMAYRDELLAVQDNAVYSRAPNAGTAGDTAQTALGFVPRGRYESVRVESKTVREYVTGSGAYTDRAETGGIEVYVWGDGTCYYRVIDQATGAVLNDRTQTEVYADQTITTATTPKVRVVDDKFHIYYIDTQASPRVLKVIVVDSTDIDDTIGSAAGTLASDVNVSSHYDVVVNDSTNQSHIAYRNNVGAGEYGMLQVDSDGTVDTDVSVARACVGVIAVSINSTWLKVLVARQSAAATIHADYLVASTHADGDNVDFAIDTVTPLQITCVAKSASESGIVLYDSLSGTSYWRVKHAASVGAVVTNNVLVRHSKLASRALIGDDSRTLVNVVLATGTQQTQYVLIDAENVVGNDNAPALGVRAAGDEVGLLARILPGEAYNQTVTTGHLPQLEKTATDTYKWAPKVRHLLSVSEEREHAGTMRSEVGIRNYTYTFGDVRGYDSVEMGKSLYIPGGYLAQYDGRRVYEAGFFVYPEIDNTAMSETVSATTADILTDGASYSYRLYWEWRNDRGEVEQSTFAGTVSKTFTGGAPDTFTIVVPTLPYTSKSNVVLAVYRSQPDPKVGDPFNRVSGPSAIGTGKESYLENDPNADTITWQDENFTDAAALSNELDYQNTGELDNVAMHVPARVIATGQSRLFWIGTADDNVVRYSKLQQPGKLVAFNESLSIEIPPAGGKVIALAAAEDSLLVFKERAVYLCAGTGPDNLGAGDYGRPQLVSSSVGCTDARSVARLPEGFAFHGDKGWFIIDRAYQLQYIGDAATSYDARNITGVIPHPDQHRFVVLSDSWFGGAYCYDYQMQQWSDWQALDGVVDAVVSQTLPYYLEPSDVVTVESPAIWTDPGTADGYSLIVDTGWISFDQITGYTRARKWQLLGGWHGAQSFDVRVRIAYGYDDTWIDDTTFTIDSADEVAGLPLRIGGRFTRGKLGSVRIRVEDIKRSVAAWGEGMRLTAIAFEIGLKKGQYRLPARQTT